MSTAIQARSGSATSAARSDWAARLFSFPVMCVFLLAAVLFGFCVRQFAEPDLWWHLRYARDLLQFHTFSAFDTYSFTAAGSYRPHFDGLSEGALYLAYQLQS